MIANVILEEGGRKWKVREARSVEDARNAIGTVLADVVELNSDGTERQPYTEAT